MTTETIINLLPYLISSIFPVVDIIGDLLPGKYVGKLRKLIRYIRLLQKNKGMEASNRLIWNVFDGKNAAIKSMLLSDRLDRIVTTLSITHQVLTSEGVPTEGGVSLTPEMGKALEGQSEALREIQKLFDETIGRKNDI